MESLVTVDGCLNSGSLVGWCTFVMLPRSDLTICESFSWQRYSNHECRLWYQELALKNS